LLRLAQQRRGESAGTSGGSSEVTRDELKAILADLLKHPAVDRTRKFDLDPLRSEYLATALVCLDGILEGAEMKALQVCQMALREGLIYDFMSRATPVSAAPRAEGDLRFRAIVDLASRCDYPIDHSHRVASLAVQIFRQTTHLHGLAEKEERLLEYACVLHDIGYHIGYSKHHKHAYYLVMNCDLRGFSPEERSILANLVRYHRRAQPKNKHRAFADLPARARKIVKYLTSILRIADGLDMSHFSVVDEIKCTAARKKINFQLTANANYSDAELDLWAAKKHARYFEKLFNVETRFAARTPARRVVAEQRRVS
jgi:exopolyphosphatase / guanosine-5'-triphosphate,3'-diphosphate pyrophosphatase